MVKGKRKPLHINFRIRVLTTVGAQAPTTKTSKNMKENNLKEETKRAWRELAEEWLEALEETNSRMGA